MASDFGPEAFEDFFARLYPPLYRYAYHLVGRDAADDLVQESFLAFWEVTQASGIKVDLNPQGYLYRIVYHRGLNIWRARRSRRAAEKLASQATAIAAATALDETERMALRDAILALPDAFRHVILQTYFAGLTAEAIADMEGAAAPAVRKRVERARTALAALFDPTSANTPDVEVTQ